MTFVLLHRDVHDRFARNQLQFITYHPPPYLLLREIIGPRPKTVLIRHWFFLCPGSGQRFVPRQDFCEESVRVETQAYAKQLPSKHASIQDRRGKVFLYDKTLKMLFARPAEGDNVNNKAIFEITCYLPQQIPSNVSTKLPNTIKIQNTNLYLSCSPEGELIPKENAKLQDKKIEMDDFNSQFFFREGKGNFSTFESMKNPQSYICTVDGDNKPVALTKGNNDQAYIELVLKDEGRERLEMEEEDIFDETSDTYYPDDRFCLEERLYFTVKI